MKKRNNTVYYFGNLLIAVSIMSFVYIIFPLFQAYFSPPPLKNILSKEGMFVAIPKIRAQARIIEHVDPWNEIVYKESLTKGVAHAKGTSLPGKSGTTFLFAHSSGMPWEITHMNTLFLRLGELQKGDTIIIVRDGVWYTYRVREKKEVWPTEVNYLLQTKKTQLILQTCAPIGTSFKRLLVFADPQ